MSVLAFDTTTSALSIAFMHQDRLYHYHEAKPKHHAEVILTVLEDLLKKADACLSDFTGIAVSNGPGSFTGVRTGVAVAQGLAFGSHLRVCGLSSLMLLAEQAYRLQKAKRVLTLLDARQNEVYWAAFERIDDQWHTHIAECVIAPDKAPLPQWSESFTVIGTGWQAYEAILAPRLPASLSILTPGYPDAEDLLTLAKTAVFTEPDQLMPVYYRKAI